MNNIRLQLKRPQLGVGRRPAQITQSGEPRPCPVSLRHTPPQSQKWERASPPQSLPGILKALLAEAGRVSITRCSFTLVDPAGSFQTLGSSDSRVSFWVLKINTFMRGWEDYKPVLLCLGRCRRPAPGWPCCSTPEPVHPPSCLEMQLRKGEHDKHKWPLLSPELFTAIFVLSTF